MARRALLVAVVLLLAAPSARSAPPAAGVDRPVPRDAEAYLVADSLEALAAMTASLGVPLATAASQLPKVIFFPEIDRRRPIAVTWLTANAQLLHLPVADPVSFARKLAARPFGGWERVIPGSEYVVLLSDNAPPPEQLGSDPVAAAPLLSGALRGFIATDGSPVRMGIPIPDDLTAGIRRVDFAVRVDGGTSELEVAVAPGANGFLAALAHAEVPAARNRFLAGVPAASQIAMSWRMTPEVAAEWQRLTAIAMSQAKGKHARAARFEREARHWSALTGGDSALAVLGIGSASMSAIQAGGCRDRDKMRRLLRRWMRLGGDRGSGVEVVELREAVANLDGVEVDEQHLRLSLPEGTPPPMVPFLSEPIRYAFPPGAVVSLMGAGGLPALREAVDRLASGIVDPGLEAAVDARAVLAVVVDVREIGSAFGATELPPDLPRHATLNLVPHDGVVSMRLTVPSMLLRFLPSLAHFPKAAPPDRT
jgi:hypothetical protein